MGGGRGGRIFPFSMYRLWDSEKCRVLTGVITYRWKGGGSKLTRIGSSLYINRWDWNFEHVRLLCTLAPGHSKIRAPLPAVYRPWERKIPNNFQTWGPTRIPSFPPIYKLWDSEKFRVLTEAITRDGEFRTPPPPYVWAVGLEKISSSRSSYT